jgi:hypothetical protein
MASEGFRSPSNSISDHPAPVSLVPRLRWSWELSSSLTEGDGQDPEALLLDELPLYVLDQARLAMWGVASGPGGLPQVT